MSTYGTLLNAIYREPGDRNHKQPDVVWDYRFAAVALTRAVLLLANCGRPVEVLRRRRGRRVVVVVGASAPRDLEVSASVAV